MKRLSMLVALSAVLAAGLVGSAAQAQQLTGSVMLQNNGAREIPADTYETGRYARFIMDERLSDINLKNRDYEAWKPLDSSDRQKMRHFMFGRLQTTSDSPIHDQEIGRYVRVLEDDRLVRNNIELNDRSFYGYQIKSPYMAQAGSAMAKSYIRGLPTGTGLGPVMPQPELIGGNARVLYFWQ